jgi:dTDP-4-amino-4,6-dideoxygalactose transaminase
LSFSTKPARRAAFFSRYALFSTPSSSSPYSQAGYNLKITDLQAACGLAEVFEGH